MPFYEYRCSACQHQDSFLESINAPQQKSCPQCGKRRAFKRLVSAAGFQLKGSGWYVTDFKNKDKPKSKDKPAEKKGDDSAAAAATDTKKSSEKTDSGEKKSDDKASKADSAKSDTGKKSASAAKN